MQRDYYTLSTIAQTLAGALAVLVAFVLFRLTEFERVIRQAQAALQLRSENWREGWELLLEGGIEGLKQKASNLTREARQYALYNEALSAWHSRPQIIRRLNVALGFTPAIGCTLTAAARATMMA
jgi:hypothetical protein